MADCSAAGTTIDRAARAVLGGAGAASAAATASKHVGALLGHASMLSAASATVHGNVNATTTATTTATAAVGSMPLVAPDHLVLPGARMQAPPAREAQSQPPMGPASAMPAPQLQRQLQPQLQPNQHHPMAMHHPTGPSTFAPPLHHQQQQIIIHQQQQFQMQMQQQQQQQQQAMAMMLHQQQQQQQQFQMRQKQQQQLQQQQQQHAEQSSAEQQQQQQQQQQQSNGGAEDAWHEWVDEGIHDLPEGTDIEELARAWSQAEAEYDSVLLDHELQQRRQEAGGEQLVGDDGDYDYDYDYDYANLWQGNDNDNNLHSLTNEPRPYEFIHSVAAADTTNVNANVNANNKIDATLDYMQQGMEQFREGNIREAILSFEMELQLRNMDNATAWRMLGKCHAENDQDPEAIRCLEAAVDKDPFCPEALLALGVSYVNELRHEKALENLGAWFTHNPKYAGLEFAVPDATQSQLRTQTRTRTRTAEEDIYGAAPNAALDPNNNNSNNNDDITASHRNGGATESSAFDEVQSMLLAALAFDPTDDAGDVYEALGVIYSVNRDYESATDAFRKALESRPDDYALWNKLGATLANGNRSDEALPMYSRCLQLKPRYARAWLNMAISHSNLGDHDEAARCYLQTLSLNPAATHCWTYLRMSLSSRERWDLLPLVFERNLEGFREHFDFVLHENNNNYNNNNR